MHTHVHVRVVLISRNRSNGRKGWHGTSTQPTKQRTSAAASSSQQPAAAVSVRRPSESRASRSAAQPAPSAARGRSQPPSRPTVAGSWLGGCQPVVATWLRRPSATSEASKMHGTWREEIQSCSRLRGVVHMPKLAPQVQPHAVSRSLKVEVNTPDCGSSASQPHSLTQPASQRLSRPSEARGEKKSVVPPETRAHDRPVHNVASCVDHSSPGWLMISPLFPFLKEGATSSPPLRHQVRDSRIRSTSPERP